MSKQSRREWKLDGEVIAKVRLAERPGDIDAEQFLANHRFVDRAIVRWPAERAENDRLRVALAYLSDHRWCEMCCGDQADPHPIKWDGHTLRCVHCGTEAPFSLEPTQ